MPAQSAAITERQLELITRAHCDANGLVEPLLDHKGGAKQKMIPVLAQRGLIEQREGQWRITRTAIAIVKGEAQPQDVLPPLSSISVSSVPAPADDPQLQATVTAAEASWQQAQPDTAPKRGRENSKQALVIEMLKRPEGATIAQIVDATGWQAHTTRGFFAGALKKKLGLTIVSEKIEGPAGTPGAGERLYRIAQEVSA